MAKKKVKCLVLLDEPAYGLVCGQVVELDETLARQLEGARRIDVSEVALKAAEVGQPDAVDQHPDGAQPPQE